MFLLLVVVVVVLWWSACISTKPAKICTSANNSRWTYLLLLSSIFLLHFFFFFCDLTLVSFLGKKYHCILPQSVVSKLGWLYFHLEALLHMYRKCVFSESLSQKKVYNTDHSNCKLYAWLILFFYVKYPMDMYHIYRSLSRKMRGNKATLGNVGNG